MVRRVVTAVTSVGWSCDLCGFKDHIS